MQQGYYNGSSLNLHFEILFKNSGFFSILQYCKKKKQGRGWRSHVAPYLKKVSCAGDAAVYLIH